MKPSVALSKTAPILLSILSIVGFAGEARADELSLDWGGRIQSDLRFRTETKGIGGYYNRIELPAGVERNQNALGLKLNAAYGDYKGVAQIDFVFNSIPYKVKGLEDLQFIENVDPYRFEALALYIEAKNIVFDGLDVRIGQQVVSWGVADQFNPTNNLNPDDLRDPLLFGRQAANFMVKADYWVSENFSISGALVPVFKPALLPLSSPLGIGAIDRLPFLSTKLRNRIEAEKAASAGSLIDHPTIVSKANVVLPEPGFDNMQVAYRLAGTIWEQDIALSYYNGRTDFPQPFRNHTRHRPGKQCNPKDPNDCIEGLLATEVSLHYPRMHVYGLNVTGEFNPFKWISEEINGLGYRVEGALVVPAEASLKLTNDELDLAFPQPAGEYDYGGERPTVVDATPFLKWTLGLDYTFGEHVYTNVQWVHGLADEYGAGDFLHEGWAVRQSGVRSPDEGIGEAQVIGCASQRDGSYCAREILRPKLADYLVVGVDLKFLSDAALLRLFTLLDLSGYVEEKWDDDQEKRVRTKFSPFSAEGFSAVLFPEFDYNFGNGLELAAGALLQFGKDYTKFGDPAAGGSLIWTRAKYSF